MNSAVGTMLGNDKGITVMRYYTIHYNEIMKGHRT